MDDLRFKEFEVPCYMLDRNSRLRPGAFMDLCQQIAGEEAEALGFPDSALMERRQAVWVLARMEARFHRMPRRGDIVRLRSWHKGSDSIFFRRDYQMFDREGGTLADATSSWVVMAVDERKVLRIDTLKDIIPPQAQCPLHAIEQNTPKIVVPAGCKLEKVAEHVVTYSDVDYNGHANNAKYVGWVLDCLDEPLGDGPDLKEMTINYNNEALIAETVEILGIKDADGYLVEGRAADRQIFTCTLKY